MRRARKLVSSSASGNTQLSMTGFIVEISWECQQEKADAETLLGTIVMGDQDRVEARLWSEDNRRVKVATSLEVGPRH